MWLVVITWQCRLPDEPNAPLHSALNWTEFGRNLRPIGERARGFWSTVLSASVRTFCEFVYKRATQTADRTVLMEDQSLRHTQFSLGTGGHDGVGELNEGACKWGLRVDQV